MKVRSPWPEDRANLLVKTFFLWTWPLLRLGYQKDIEPDDLYQCSKNDDCEKAANKLRRQWKKQLASKSPSLVKAIFKAFGRKFLFRTLLVGGYELLVIEIAQPFFMGGILDYLAGKTNDVHLQFISLFGFCFCTLSFVVTHHYHIVALFRMALHIRLAVQKLVMEKLLVVSKSALHSDSGGQIINLVSNDVGRFDIAVVYGPFLMLVPFQSIIISWILWGMLGTSFVVGLIVVLAFVVVQFYMGKNFGVVRKSTSSFTDKRIRLMSQIINGMKVIKMYSWEKPFTDLIGKIRRQEISRIKVSSFLRSLNLAFSFVVTRLILFLIILTYLSLGNNLSARTVFVTIAMLNIIRLYLTQLVPMGIEALSESIISCGRIQKFLLLEEVSNIHKEHLVKSLSDYEGKEKLLEVKNLNAYWDVLFNEPCLREISFSVKPGELLTVVGPVGSGKTSLILTLLNEYHVKFDKLEVGGKVSYASQEAWIFNSTIKENILFGNPLDDARYKKVISVSNLDRDLKILHFGDMTSTGERGVGLSGGQRARVALARAVYQEADIYLLDDPLSAVDAKVANQIFKNCIKGFLSSKIVVLVTHQLHFLRNSDKILVLNQRHGKLYNSYEEFEKSGTDLEAILSLEKEKPPESRHQLSTSTANLVEDSEKSQLLVRKDSVLSRRSIASEMSLIQNFEEPELLEEELKVGSISWKVYWVYFRSGGGLILGFTVVFMTLFSQLAFSANDFWLAQWTNKLTALRPDEINYDNVTLDSSRTFAWHEVSPLDKKTNIIIYSILVGSLFLSSIIRFTASFYLCNMASMNLHNSIFYRILRAPMQFFEENPAGRILNRFSRDLGLVDEILPLTVFDFWMNALLTASVLIVVALITWYMIPPALVYFCIIILLRMYYIRTARNIKRIEASARSPVYSHISTTVDGLSTIRAFKVESIMQKKFTEHLNNHTAVWRLSQSVAETLGIWADWVCVFYLMVMMGLMFAFPDLMPSGSAGLALSQILVLIRLAEHNVRLSAELENQMTSVERIVEYTELASEAVLISETRPPTTWPKEGYIKFVNVSLKYPSAVGLSLREVSIEIKGGEKIGVVGRTGAGKSSLLSCLFRLVEPTGSIFIDDINIQSIGLDDLRKRISIIPQDPVIFSGTVRFNLDPFQEHEDSQIWDALCDVQLKEKINQVSDGLDYEIREGGENFSVGERQLICLARALLRNNKVLVIDEATANVDLMTDQLIQATIRTKFSHCTVLTIAHRLNTVIDSDRILVLDSGQVVEFDKPYYLLQNKDSHLAKLVQQTGKAMSERLIQMAKEQYHKTSTS